MPCILILGGSIFGLKRKNVSEHLIFSSDLYFDDFFNQFSFKESSRWNFYLSKFADRGWSDTHSVP